MICYKDRTFCNAKCTNTNCSIKYTEQVNKDAAIWWGSDDAPIAVADMSEGCTGYKPLEEGFKMTHDKTQNHEIEKCTQCGHELEAGACINFGQCGNAIDHWND